MKSIFYYCLCFMRRKKASLKITVLLMMLCSLLISLSILYQDSYDAYWREKYLPFSESVHGVILTSDRSVTDYLKNSGLVRDYSEYPMILCGEKEAVFPAYYLGDRDIQNGLLGSVTKGAQTVSKGQILLFSPIRNDVYDVLEDGRVRISAAEKLDIAGIERGETEEWYTVFHVAGILSETDLNRLWDGKAIAVFFRLSDYSETQLDQFVSYFTNRYSWEEAMISCQTIGIGSNRLFPPQQHAEIWSVVFIGFAMAIVGIFFCVNNSFRNEGTDISRLYALGMPRYKISGILFVENFTCFLITYPLSFLIGCGLFPLLLRATNRINKSGLVGQLFRLNKYLVLKAVLLFLIYALFMAVYILFKTEKKKTPEDFRTSELKTKGFVKQSSVRFLRQRSPVRGYAFIIRKRYRRLFWGLSALLFCILIIPAFFTTDSGEVNVINTSPDYLITPAISAEDVREAQYDAYSRLGERIVGEHPDATIIPRYTVSNYYISLSLDAGRISGTDSMMLYDAAGNPFAVRSPVLLNTLGSDMMRYLSGKEIIGKLDDVSDDFVAVVDNGYTVDGSNPYEPGDSIVLTDQEGNEQECFTVAAIITGYSEGLVSNQYDPGPLLFLSPDRIQALARKCGSLPTYYLYMDGQLSDETMDEIELSGGKLSDERNYTNEYNAITKSQKRCLSILAYVISMICVLVLSLLYKQFLLSLKNEEEFLASLGLPRQGIVAAHLINLVCFTVTGLAAFLVLYGAYCCRIYANIRKLNYYDIHTRIPIPELALILIACVTICVLTLLQGDEKRE